MRTTTDFESGPFELIFETDEFNSELVGEAWEGEVKTSPDYVRWVQQSLNRVMGLQLKVDSISGMQTRSAIRSFQQRQGLMPDGIVGPRTEQALIKAGAIPPPGFSNVSPPLISPRPPLPRTVLFSRRVLPTEVLLPTTVTIDPRDKRIDFGAKFALQRMLKKGATQLDAIRLIRAIDSGRLAGIHGDDRLEAVQIAKKLNTYRWLLVPKGEDAALVVDQLRPFSVPPTIIFRGDTPDIRNQSARIDEALRRASGSFDLWVNALLARCVDRPIEAETSFSPTPIPNIVPPILCLRRQRPFILIGNVPDNEIITPQDAKQHLLLDLEANVGRGQPNQRCDLSEIQLRLRALKLLSPENFEKERQLCAPETGSLSVDDKVIPETIKGITQLKLCLSARQVGWEPIRADEAAGPGDRFGGRTLQFTVQSLSACKQEQPENRDMDVSVFIPSKVDPIVNKVHIFFSAAGTTLNTSGNCPQGGGPDRGLNNQVLLHGLRAAFNDSDWILISIPGRLCGPDKAPDLGGFNTINLATVRQCLRLAGRGERVSEFRLSAYSRGHRGLRATISRDLLDTQGTGRNRISKVFLLDNLHETIRTTLETAGLKDRVTAYWVNCSVNCKPIGNTIKLDQECMRAIGYSRLIEDAMKREPAMTFPTDVRARMLPLPPRGCFSTSQPSGATSISNAGGSCPVVNLKQFCREMTASGQIAKALELRDITYQRNLPFFGGVVFTNETDAHHYFVAEIVHEMTR